MINPNNKNKEPLYFIFTGQVRQMGDGYIIYIKQKERKVLKNYLNQDLKITISNSESTKN